MPRFERLSYIKSHWEELCQNEGFLLALKGTPFIDVKTQTGMSLKCPSDLYDPRTKLFTQIFEGDSEAFPTGPFASESWLNLLSKFIK